MSELTKGKRKLIYDKYSGHCAYCGKEIVYKDMQVDHMKPLRAWNEADSGSDDIENLMPSCRRCNHYKRAHDLETYRELLKNTLEHKVLDTYLGKVARDYGMVKWIGWGGKFYYEKVNEKNKLGTIGAENLLAEWPSLFECSNCGWCDYDTTTGDTVTYNFCPHCGADMRGEQHG